MYSIVCHYQWLDLGCIVVIILMMELMIKGIAGDMATIPDLSEIYITI